MKRPKTFYPSEQAMEPLRKFLKKAREWQAGADVEILENCLLPSRIFELALKLSLLEVSVAKGQDVDRIKVEYGLELAKRFLVKHVATLSAVEHSGASRLPDTTDMTDRERAAFLKICEKGPISASELARSFSKMLASERDEIIANLVSRNLVSFQSGILQRIAA